MELSIRTQAIGLEPYTLPLYVQQHVRLSIADGSGVPSHWRRMILSSSGPCRRERSHDNGTTSSFTEKREDASGIILGLGLAVV